MFQFFWPWFAILIPLPLLIRAFSSHTSINNEEPPALRVPFSARIKSSFPVSSGASSPTATAKRGLYYFASLFLAWTCLVLAVMQPEKVNHFSHVVNEGYDLLLAVDISGSMQAVDFSTNDAIVNRLDAIKDIVGKFVESRKGDRVGLITFGENAYLYTPLTYDTVAVRDMLNEISTGMAGNATAIGDAIGLGVKILRDRPEGSRVLMLLTDGEDNVSQVPPLKAAELAKQYGVKIYTVGVGKNGPVPFPNGFGGYAMAEMPIDEALLKNIASMTGGVYYRATDQRSLKEIYDSIDKLEKTKTEKTSFFIREPLYTYPLGAAILLLILLAITPVCRRIARGA